MSKRNRLNNWILALLYRDIKCGRKALLYKTYRQLLFELSLQLGGCTMKRQAIVRHCLREISPLMNFRSYWHGGRRLVVPYILDDQEALKLGLKMLFKSIKVRHESRYSKRFVFEFVDIFNGYGKTISRRNELHKLCARYKTNIRFLNYEKQVQKKF